MRTGLLTVATAILLGASGCVIAPAPQGSVSHDLIDYFQREWPLNGLPTVSATGDCNAGCQGGSWTHNAACGEHVYADDWNQGHTVVAPDPLPEVPLDPPPGGRFFPVPTQPAFEPPGMPQDPSAVGFEAMPKAAG